MYIQITTRCNMTCAHCCYSCTEKGEDMSLETFRNALKWGDEVVSIGGGEPTIHPLFWQFIGEALGSKYLEYLWLATNGKKTRTALALSRMAKRGVLGCELSQDEYHDQIDPEVIAAFTPEKRKTDGLYGQSNPTDARGIRDVTHNGSKNVMRAGRAVDWDNCADDGCVCEDMFIHPDGSVTVCGCKDAPVIGNVNDDKEIDYPPNSGECWKEQPEEDND